MKRVDEVVTSSAAGDQLGLILDRALAAAMALTPLVPGRRPAFAGNGGVLPSVVCARTPGTPRDVARTTTVRPDHKEPTPAAAMLPQPDYATLASTIERLLGEQQKAVAFVEQWRAWSEQQERLGAAGKRGDLEWTLQRAKTYVEYHQATAQLTAWFAQEERRLRHEAGLAQQQLDKIVRKLRPSVRQWATRGLLDRSWMEKLDRIFREDRGIMPLLEALSRASAPNRWQILGSRAAPLRETLGADTEMFRSSLSAAERLDDELARLHRDWTRTVEGWRARFPPEYFFDANAARVARAEGLSPMGRDVTVLAVGPAGDLAWIDTLGFGTSVVRQDDRGGVYCTGICRGRSYADVPPRAIDDWWRALEGSFGYGPLKRLLGEEHPLVTTKEGTAEVRQDDGAAETVERWITVSTRDTAGAALHGSWHGTLYAPDCAVFEGEEWHIRVDLTTGDAARRANTVGAMWETIGTMPEARMARVSGALRAVGNSGPETPARTPRTSETPSQARPAPSPRHYHWKTVVGTAAHRR